MKFFWALVFVAVAAGGIYLADRLVLAPSRAMQRQLAEKEAQIRALTERNQALEAAIRLLR
jgi:cell division protein FtsB